MHFRCVQLLLTQLHGGARLVDCVLTGTQAVLQLGGSRLRGRGGADGVCRVHQRRGGARRRRPGGPWRRRVSDFAAHLAAAASSSAHWAGQTGASAGAKRSPAEGEKGGERGEKGAINLEWRRYVCPLWFRLNSQHLGGGRLSALQQIQCQEEAS